MCTDYSTALDLTLGWSNVMLHFCGKLGMMCIITVATKPFIYIYLTFFLSYFFLNVCKPLTLQQNCTKTDQQKHSK